LGINPPPEFEIVYTRFQRQLAQYLCRRLAEYSTRRPFTGITLSDRALVDSPDLSVNKVYLLVEGANTGRPVFDNRLDIPLPVEIQSRPDLIYQFPSLRPFSVWRKKLLSTSLSLPEIPLWKFDKYRNVSWFETSSRLAYYENARPADSNFWFIPEWRPSWS